jgi:hypothetical protein
VLVQRAARGNVEHLHAAADAEHGDVTLERPVRERKLEAVALLGGAGRLVVRARAVGARIHVAAAGEHDGVEAVEQLVGVAGDVIVGREDDGKPAGALDGEGVGPGKHVGLLFPGAEPDALDGCAESDDGTAHAAAV